MRDYWIAECLPCKWETRHDTQDAAITAAEGHVDSLHRHVQPIARAQKYMGHVTQRTVLDTESAASAAPEPQTQSEAPTPDASADSSTEQPATTETGA